MVAERIPSPAGFPEMRFKPGLLSDGVGGVSPQSFFCHDTIPLLLRKMSHEDHTLGPAVQGNAGSGLKHGKSNGPFTLNALEAYGPASVYHRQQNRLPGERNEFLHKRPGYLREAKALLGQEVDAEGIEPEGIPSRVWIMR